MLKPEKIDSQVDEKHLEQLYTSYGKKLFRFGHKQWKIPKDACWSLVYSCLYKVEEQFRALSFETEKQRNAYVFKVFVNKMKNHLRDEKLKMRGNQEVGLEEDKLSSGNETMAEERIEVRVLNSILDELEDWQRILMLMRAQEYSYSEIAKYTGKSEKNLKVYYGRLKKKVAIQMEDELKKVKTHEK